MSEEEFASIWDAIEETPAEAENMKLRAGVMIALRDRIARMKWTQNEAAFHLGVTQPRISDLMRGKIDLFSLDALIKMASMAGLEIEMHTREKLSV